MIKPFHFTIPLPPVTKKNSQEIITKKENHVEMIGKTAVVVEKNKPIPLPSKQFRSYQEGAGWYITHRGDKINEPLEIKCIFYTKTRRRTDLTNLLEAIDDILVHYDVIEDDNYNIIVSHDGSRVFYDKENPRTEVYISSYVADTEKEEEVSCPYCSLSQSPCLSCSDYPGCNIKSLCEKKKMWDRIREGKGYCPECGRKL